LLYCIVIFSFWEFFYFYSFSAKRYISKISKNNIAKSTLLVYHAYNDLWWLSGSTWCHSVCRTIFMNSNWFLLCVDTTAMDPRMPLHERLRMNRSAGRLIVSDANDVVESLCWMKLHYEHLRENPPRLRERSRRRETEWHCVSESWWSDTRDKCSAGVTHQENLRDTHQSSFHVLLHYIVHMISFAFVLQR